MQIAITTGHIESVPGVTHYSNSLGKELKEHEECRKVTKLLIEKLKSINNIHVLDIDKLLDMEINRNKIKKYYDSLELKCELTENYKCDFLIELHMNAYNTHASGSEIWISKWLSHKDMRYQLSGYIAEELHQNNLVEYRGLKQMSEHDKDFFIMRRLKIPAIIIEFLFLDNDDDNLLLKYKNIYNLFSNIVFNGIKKYYLRQLNLVDLIY